MREEGVEGATKKETYRSIYMIESNEESVEG